MVEETTNFIKIDLNQFKLHLYLKQDAELTLHFDSPSRRFYLSVIALVVHEMKKQGRITSIPLQEQLDVLALLNKTVGGSAGSSKKEHLLPRVYRKWKDALPDLENAPLFKVVGRKKRYDDSIDKVYGFGEGEKDSWANLFEYKGSHEHVRLRFSIDRLDASLNDVILVFGEYPAKSVNEDAWEGFIAHLKEKLEARSIPEQAHDEFKEPELPLLRQRRWLGSLPNRWRWPVLVTLITFVAGAAIFAVWKSNLFAPQVEVASVKRMAIPLPDKPSIAVLPFRNLSDDPKLEYFSDGLTEEIISALFKVPNLFVIARNSTFMYKDKAVNVQQVAEKLGVRYVLEGSVRKTGDKMRITAQLIDAITGRHLWTERYDRELIDIFALQDEITLKIVIAMQIELTEGEQARLKREPPNLNAYLKTLEVYALLSDFRPENIMRIRRLAEEAVALDSSYAAAYDSLGWSHVMAVMYGLNTGQPHFSLERAFELGQKALSLDRTLLSAHRLLANVYTLKKKHWRAINQMELCLRYNPSAAGLQFDLAKFLMNADKPEESIAHYKRAIRLNPYPTVDYFHNFGCAYWMTGQYNEAIEVSKKGLKRNPDDMFTHMVLAVSYIETDRIEEARAAATEVLRINPKVSLDWLAKMLPWENRAEVDRWISDLRKAGLN